MVLLIAFALYLAIFAYIVFFSRRAAEDYKVHIALFENLARSVNIDFGVLGFLQTMISEGPVAAFSQVHIEAPRYIGEVYLNISVRNLAKVRHRLEADGIEVGPIVDDYFQGIQRFTFDGPDNVHITFLETYVG